MQFQAHHLSMQIFIVMAIHNCAGIPLPFHNHHKHDHSPSPIIHQPKPIFFTEMSTLTIIIIITNVFNVIGTNEFTLIRFTILDKYNGCTVMYIANRQTNCITNFSILTASTNSIPTYKISPSIVGFLLFCNTIDIDVKTDNMTVIVIKIAVLMFLLIAAMVAVAELVGYCIVYVIGLMWIDLCLIGVSTGAIPSLLVTTEVILQQELKETTKHTS